MPTHKNERRPGGRAAPVPVYSGWAPLPCAVWMEVAETFAKPWSRPVACADLTTYQSVAIQPVDPVRFPSIGDLTERWGWSAHEVRRLLTDEAAWSDPTLTGNGDRAARWAAIKDARTSRSGSHGSRTDRARIEHGSHKDATVKPTESTTKAREFNEDRARIALTSLNTRVGSQSTEHRAQTQEKHAPAPAVADLFASLASHTDADTGKATGDTTPPPGSAAPLPVKAKRERKAPDMTAELGRVLDAFATFDPVRAQKAREGKNAGVIDEATKAIRLLGADRIEARLRWVGANQSHKDVVWLLEHHGWASLFVHGKPTVNRFDDAAAMEASTPAATVDARTDASAAWFDMTSRRGWKSVGARCFNQHDDFGGSTGFDLADDQPEHARRFHAFRAAGGMIGWDKAGENNGAGRAAFRERFMTAYMAGGKA